MGACCCCCFGNVGIVGLYSTTAFIGEGEGDKNM